MVWEQGVAIIVMITNLVERGRVSSIQYNGLLLDCLKCFTSMAVTNLERVACACILEEAVNQLVVLGTGAPTTRLLFRPVMERIYDCGSSKIYNKESWRLTEEAYKLLEPATLNKIRFFSEDVLEALRLELLTDGTTETIENVLKKEYNCRVEEKRLLEETLKHTKEVVAVETRIKAVTLKAAEEMNEKEMELAVLQDQMLDLQHYKAVSRTFTEQRIGAKLSQISMWLRDHEHSLAQTIDFNMVACDLQDRVHVEILNYLDSLIQDLKCLVEYWTERNKTEMTEMNLKLDKLQQSRYEQSLQIQALSSLFKMHNEEINSYLEERTAREHKHEIQQHISLMATRIQAWWRGTMVRRHLGPYKIDKKKKPKDKPKKKK